MTVTPQVIDDLVDIEDRHHLTFAVVSDHDDALARQLGIAFEPDAASRAKGADVGAITGTGRWQLPMPAVDRRGTGPGGARRRRQPRLAGAHRSCRGDRCRLHPGGPSDEPAGLGGGDTAPNPVEVQLRSAADPEALAQLHERVVRTAPVGHTLQRAVPVRVELA